jgi:FMN phosphatase YigB (HAD superfamily)
MPVITAVVFDLDGVLCRYQIERRLARLAAWSGKSSEAIHAAIWGSGFENDVECGGLSADEYLRGFGEHMGYPLSAAHGCAPDEILYFDDNAAYVAGAREAGLSAHRVGGSKGRRSAQSCHSKSVHPSNVPALGPSWSKSGC